MNDHSEPATAQPDLTFADLGLGQAMLAALRGVGYETPSAIQAKTIPHLLAGQDVVGLAQTGTGKTAAFALPILEQLDVHQKAPQVLVLAPTRELAVQVCEAFEKYAGHLRGVHMLPVYGGQGYGVQLSALRRGVHVVVGTPGRIMDHLEKGTLDLSQLRFCVLDEADEMLKMGFAEDVETILARHPGDQAGRTLLGHHAARRSADWRRATSMTRSRSPSRARRPPPPTSPSVTSSSATRRRSTRSPASSRWRTSRR